MHLRYSVSAQHTSVRNMSQSIRPYLQCLFARTVIGHSCQGQGEPARRQQGEDSFPVSCNELRYPNHNV